MLFRSGFEDNKVSTGFPGASLPIVKVKIDTPNNTNKDIKNFLAKFFKTITSTYILLPDMLQLLFVKINSNYVKTILIQISNVYLFYNIFKFL